MKKRRFIMREERNCLTTKDEKKRKNAQKHENEEGSS
jgi:hypothetical protein